jgi:regulator of replication initiation timing
MSDIIEMKAQQLAAKLSVSQLNIDDLDEQIKVLQGKKKKLTTELDQFKDDLREAMVEHGVTRIESDDILFRLDKPSTVLKVTDESAIPKKYFKVVEQLDKMAVKKALQVGDDVEGAELSEGKHRLTIKA